MFEGSKSQKLFVVNIIKRVCVEEVWILLFFVKMNIWLESDALNTSSV